MRELCHLHRCLNPIVLGIAAVALALAGCVGAATPPASSTSIAGAGPASPSTAPQSTRAIPDVALDPLVAPEALPGGCANYGTTVDFAPTTLEMDARASKAVVIGRVVAVGAAQWNTEDGKPPKDPDIDATRVMRLIRVEVDTPVARTTPATFTAFIPGGTIGCNRFTISGFPEDLKVGSQWAVFLGGNAPRAAAATVLGADVFEATRMWPIDGDTVNSPDEGQMSIATFSRRAAAAVAVP